MNIDNQPQETAFAIKAVCTMGFINAAQMVKLVFSPVTKHLGTLYSGYFAISVALTLICLAGLWQQKKWVALTYSLLLACNQAVLPIMGFWEPAALIIPAVIVGLLYKYKKQLG